jgi:hypothetical protein
MGDAQALHAPTAHMQALQALTNVWELAVVSNLIRGTAEVFAIQGCKE